MYPKRELNVAVTYIIKVSSKNLSGSLRCEVEKSPVAVSLVANLIIPLV